MSTSDVAQGSTEDEVSRRYLESCPTYQRYDAMKLIREAARLLARPGDKVIYRDAFRWKDDATDSVLSNHYEMFSIAGICNDFGYELLHNFEHVAVIRDKCHD